MDSLDGEEGEQQPVDPDTQAMPPPTAPVPKSVRTKKKVRRTRKDEDDEDDDEDEENISMNNSRSSKLKFIHVINFHVSLKSPVTSIVYVLDLQLEEVVQVQYRKKIPLLKTVHLMKKK